MLETDDKTFIRFKIGLALKNILEENKDKKRDNPKLEFIVSYGKLEINTFFRKATLISIFNGQSSPDISTLLTILSALGTTFSDFAKSYDALTTSEVKEYKKVIEKKRNARLKK